MASNLPLIAAVASGICYIAIKTFDLELHVAHPWTLALSLCIATTCFIGFRHWAARPPGEKSGATVDKANDNANSRPDSLPAAHTATASERQGEANIIDTRQTHHAAESFNPSSFTVSEQHPYYALIKEMRNKFEEMLSLDPSKWILVSNMTNPPFTKVYQLVGAQFCFKIETLLDTNMDTAFDFIADIENRPKWDDQVVQAEVVDVVDEYTCVQRLQTRGIWPAAPREGVLLSNVYSTSDGRYCMVSQSITHDKVPDKTDQGIIRMNAKVGARYINPVPDNVDIPNREEWCQMVEIVDSDLNGWIPKSLVSFVATKAMPMSIQKLNQTLVTIPKKHLSATIWPNGKVIASTSTKLDNKHSLKDTSSEDEDEVASIPTKPPTSLSGQATNKLDYAVIRRPANTMFTPFTSIMTVFRTMFRVHNVNARTVPWLVTIFALWAFKRRR